MKHELAWWFSFDLVLVRLKTSCGLNKKGWRKPSRKGAQLSS